MSTRDSSTSASKAALLVPAYNVRPWPDEFVGRLSSAADTLKRELRTDLHLVLVDDGSWREGTDAPSHLAALERLGFPVTLARHCINRGQGAALQTALEIARSGPVSADYFVTFDADGQHDPRDIPVLLSALRERGLNVVFGTRFGAGRSEGMPWLRRCVVAVATVFDRAVTGLRLSDAHNGFRAFDRAAASRIEIHQDRMAHATEIKSAVARAGLKYGEVGVRVTYTRASLSEGQGNMNALNILRELLEAWWFG